MVYTSQKIFFFDHKEGTKATMTQGGLPRLKETEKTLSRKKNKRIEIKKKDK